MSWFSVQGFDRFCQCASGVWRPSPDATRRLGSYSRVAWCLRCCPGGQVEGFVTDRCLAHLLQGTNFAVKASTCRLMDKHQFKRKLCFVICLIYSQFGLDWIHQKLQGFFTRLLRSLICACWWCRICKKEICQTLCAFVVHLCGSVSSWD